MRLDWLLLAADGYAAVVVAGYCAAGLAGCRTEGCISLLGRGSLVVLTDVVVVVELAAVVAV